VGVVGIQGVGDGTVVGVDIEVETGWVGVIGVGLADRTTWREVEWVEVDIGICSGAHPDAKRITQKRNKLQRVFMRFLSIDLRQKKS
jgi:hypothetical protein